MKLTSRKMKFYMHSSLKHDLTASVNVFLEALPLCIGIALASGVPIYSGFITGIIGGIIVAALSGSRLCIRGPGTGLITVCVAAIAMLGGNLEYFFAAIALAGLLQVLLGSFNMGGFTYFIPSVVVKGMLAAIGILLIIQQLPFAIGDKDIDASGKVSFYHFLSVSKIIDHSVHIRQQISPGVIIISMVSVLILYVWEKKFSKKWSFMPTYLIVTLAGIGIAYFFKHNIPQLALNPSQYITIPHNLLADIQFIHIPVIFVDTNVWRAAVLICLVSSIESLVTVEAIDKADPNNEITPRNQELVAQGAGNILTGLLGGLPIIALIARSTTNLDSGARTKLASMFQGLWLLMAALIIPNIGSMIPYSVFAIIIMKIGLKLANPAIFKSMYRAGRKQFEPFIVTIVAIILTDLLVGVLAGIVYSFYVLVVNNFKAAYFVNMRHEGHIQHFMLELAPEVSFLNKKGIIKALDEIPAYSVVEVVGTNGGNIDYDILEAIYQYKSKAHNRHIELILKDLPEQVQVQPDGHEQTKDDAKKKLTPKGETV